ncbi:MAG: hypothetical protein NVSMB1_05910 [Polyangiales bacterium]
MLGYCPGHQSRSPFKGPATAVVKTYLLGFTGATPPTIAADGTAYVVGSSGSEDQLYPMKSDGTASSWFLRLGHCETQPAIAADGTIYLGTFGGVLATSKTGCEAYRPDGKLKARSPTPLQIHWSPVIGADGTVYMASNDFVYAFAPDCTVKWSYQGAGPIQGAASLSADGTVYVPIGRSMVALTASGSLKWSSAPVETHLDQSAMLADDGTIYGIETSGTLHAWRPTDGVEMWKLALPNGDHTPAIGADGTIYVASGSDLKAIRKNGSIAWAASVLDLASALRVSAPVIDGNGLILAPTFYPTKEVAWLRAFRSTGQVEWTGGSYSSSGSDLPVSIGLDARLFANGPGGLVSYRSP